MPLVSSWSPSCVVFTSCLGRVRCSRAPTHNITFIVMVATVRHSPYGHFSFDMFLFYAHRPHGQRKKERERDGGRGSETVAAVCACARRMHGVAHRFMSTVVVVDCMYARLHSAHTHKLHPYVNARSKRMYMYKYKWAWQLGSIRHHHHHRRRCERAFHAYALHNA